MKKIVVVAYDLNPALGSECAVAAIWVEILSKYFDVYVFVNKKHKKDIEKDEKIIKANFIYIEVNQKYSWLYRFLGLEYFVDYRAFVKACYSQLNALINKHEIKLIHCLTPEGVYYFNSFYKFGIPVCIGPVGGGLQFFISTWKAYRGQHFAYLVKNIVCRYMKLLPSWKKYFQSAVLIIVGTRYMKPVLPSDCQSRIVEIFDTAIRFDKIADDNKKERTGDIIRVIFAGRLTAHKGIWLAIDAVKRFLEIGGRNIVLDIFGKGPLYKRLAKYVKNEGLSSHINIIGQVPYEEYKTLFVKYDILLYPALQDPGGTVVLDAMANSLPVICLAYGGPDISILENCGIKIPLARYDDMVDAIATALELLSKNRNLFKKMGENARKRVEQKFSLGALEKKILEVYDEVLT